MKGLGKFPDQKITDDRFAWEINSEGSDFKSPLLAFDDDRWNGETSKPDIEPHHEERTQIPFPSTTDAVLNFEESSPRSSGHLRVHKATNSGKSPYRYGPKELQTRKNLAHHPYHQWRYIVKPHKCEVCGEGFAQRKQLTEHNRIHTGEKPFQCDTCWKVLLSSSTLKQHQKTHSDERRYKCTVCSKTFNVLRYLTRHQTTHSDERRYKCGICSETFKRLDHLTSHQKTHSDERRYKCEICSTAYKRRHDLTKHNMKTHTGDGERQHKSERCSNFYRTC